MFSLKKDVFQCALQMTSVIIGFLFKKKKNANWSKQSVEEQLKMDFGVDQKNVVSVSHINHQPLHIFFRNTFSQAGKIPSTFPTGRFLI